MNELVSSERMRIAITIEATFILSLASPFATIYVLGWAVISVACSSALRALTATKAKKANCDSQC